MVACCDWLEPQLRTSSGFISTASPGTSLWSAPFNCGRATITPGAKRGRDEDDLDRSLCDRPVGIGEFGLGSAGCAGRGTGGRRTLLVAAADPPSPPSRPRTPFAVALVGP